MSKASQSFVIEDAVQADADWILPLFNSHKAIFGNTSGIWHRFWHSEYNRERFVVVRPKLGFAHYRIRLDGWKTVYEIATSPEARRTGVARAMIDYIGRPIRLKTDVDNESSNAFYLSLGFKLVGVAFSKSGKAMNEYVLCAE